MSNCYLCNYNNKKRKPAGVGLHRFPKHPETRKQWYSVCGLSEDIDNVKTTRICTSHFASDVVQPPLGVRKYPTLRFGAVPSISVPYPACPIQDQIQIPSFEFQDVMDYSSTSTNDVLLTFTTTHSVEEDSTTKSVCTQTVVGEGCGTNSVCTQTGESQDSPDTTKKRRFQDPRYISEVTLSDMSTPERAKKVIDLIKRVDAEKSKKIKQLQHQRRNLIKRLQTFKEFIKQHRKNNSMKSRRAEKMDEEVIYEGPIEDLLIIESSSRPQSDESDFSSINSQPRALTKSVSKKKKRKINEGDMIGNLLDDAVHC